MTKHLLVSMLLVLFVAGCGDDVTRKQRTVYVDEEGNAVDASGKVIEPPNQGPDPLDTPVLPGEETGDLPNNPAGTTLEGAIVSITALGLIQGWALDKDTSAKTIQVRFYIGADQSSGTEIGVATADKPGFDNNNEGNHRFEFVVPDEYRDGSAKLLVANMEDDAQEGPISAEAKSFTAYAPTAAGQTYYNNTVQPNLVNNCESCHPGEITYENHYRLLLDKSPAAGGKATENRLILKAIGQLDHGGNNRCGNINNGSCALLQEWWQREFGG